MRGLQTQILCVSMSFYFVLNGPWTSDPGEELRMSTQIALRGPIVPGRGRKLNVSTPGAHLSRPPSFLATFLLDIEARI